MIATFLAGRQPEAAAGVGLPRARAVVSADGMTLQEVLGATKARVSSTVGTPVESLELLPSTTPSPEPDEPALAQESWGTARRFPPPTD